MRSPHDGSGAYQYEKAATTPIVAYPLAFVIVSTEVTGDKNWRYTLEIRRDAGGTQESGGTPELPWNPDYSFNPNCSKMIAYS